MIEVSALYHRHNLNLSLSAAEQEICSELPSHSREAVHQSGVSVGVGDLMPVPTERAI